jgi:hypothetical protein
MRVEEGEGALAGDGGGAGFEVGALIAVEAVASVFVDEQWKTRMGLLDFLDFGGRDVFVLGAEMEHDRATRMFGGEF